MLNNIIFFDLYQTLIDVNLDPEKKKADEAEGWGKIAKSLEKYGVNIIADELEVRYEKSRDDFYANGRDRKVHHHDFCGLIGGVIKESAGVELTKSEITEAIYEYRKISRGYIRLYPKVYETLTLLSKQYILAAASHTQGCFTQTELKELDIDKFFTYFIYTSDVGFRKESPEFYKECLRIVGKEAKNCVMIGDNYDVDVLVPAKLGFRAIWVKNPATSPRYTHLFAGEPENWIALEEFDKLPEVIVNLLGWKQV